MWQQTYSFAGGSLAISALIAAIPLVILFYLLGVRRTAGWIAALSALAATWLVVILAVRMPVAQAVAATAYGAAFGLFPISWIVFSSIMLYRVAVETGKFEIIKDSLGATRGRERASRRGARADQDLPAGQGGLPHRGVCRRLTHFRKSVQTAQAV